MQEFKPGQIIQDKYEVKEVFKEDLAIVYKVLDTEYNKFYSMKIYRDEYLRNMEKFLNALNNWVELKKHTNILFANFISNIEGTNAIFLEYLETKMNLKTALSKTNLIIDEVLDIAIQFCNGMEYAYKNGMIHGSINEEYLILKRDDRFPCGFVVKISEFGIVNSLNVNKLKFLPPEKFPEETKNMFGYAFSEGVHSDIYSFGLMLYTMLKNKYPFSYRDDEELIIKIFTEKPPLPLIHVRLDNLILKCLEKVPTKRYKNWTELKNELIEIYEEIMKKKYFIIGKEEQLSYEEYNNRGYAFFKMQKYEDAIKYFNKALELNSKDEKIWNNIGNSYLSLKDYEKAINCFEHSLKLNNKNPKILYNKGYCLSNIGKYKEAIGCYTQCLEINPKNDKAWYNMGNDFTVLEKYKDAINSYTKALEINPKYDKAWHSMGNVLTKVRNYADALYCYDKVLEINERDEKAWFNKGIILSEIGKTKLAIECYDKVLLINAKDGDAWYNKGLLFYKIGDKKSAIDCFNKARIINSKFSWYGKEEDKEKKRNKVLEVLKRIDTKDLNLIYDIIDIYKSYEIDFKKEELQISSETKYFLLKLILTKINSFSLFYINTFLVGDKEDFLTIGEIDAIKEKMQNIKFSEGVDYCHFILSLNTKEDDWIEQFDKMKNRLEKINDELPKKFLARTFVFSFSNENPKNFLKEYQIAFNCTLKCSILYNDVVLCYRKINDNTSEFIIITLKERDISEIIGVISSISLYNGKIWRYHKIYKDYYSLAKKIEEKVKSLNEKINKEIEEGNIKSFSEIEKEEIYLSDLKSSIREDLLTIKANISNSEQIFTRFNEERFEDYDKISINFIEDAKLTEELYKNLYERIGAFKDTLREKLDIAKEKSLMMKKECLIDEVFLTTLDGRMISHQTRRLMPDEEDIVIAEGMLTAIRDFVRDNKGLELRSFEYGNFKVIIEEGEDAYLSVVLTGEIPNNLRGEMLNTLKEIERNFPKIKNWDGDKEELPKIDSFLNEFIKKFYK